MTKREKVLQALELCANTPTGEEPTCSVCPYKDDQDFTLSCREMMRDILKLLKENEDDLLYHVGDEASANELGLDPATPLFSIFTCKRGKYEYSFRYFGYGKCGCFEVREISE